MRAYSIDLRQKVIEFIKQSKTQKSAAKIFNLNKATVNRWWLRHKQEGHVCPRKNLGKKASVSKVEFEAYVRANPNFTTADMGKHFNISSPGALYYLKKFGFSYKKKPLAMWKQMRKKEETIKN